MKKLITLTAMAAFAGVVGLWYKNTRPKPVLPRTTVIQMLRRIDKESYMILCQMAACVAEIIKSSPTPPSPENIQELFKSPELGFPELFEQLYNALYQDFKTTEEEFQYSIEKGYANDAEIQFYRKRLAEDFHKAMLGTTPDIDRACPISLGPEKVLDIIKSILDQQIRIFQQGLKLIKQPVPLKPFKQASDEVLNKSKKQIYEKYQLHDLKDNPERILQLAISLYSKNDTKFLEDYKAITAGFESKMNELIQTNQGLFK